MAAAAGVAVPQHLPHAGGDGAGAQGAHPQARHTDDGSRQMNPNLEEIWVYLSTSPLLGLTLTLLAYQAAFWIYKRVGFHPLANPVLLSVAILASLLLATGTPYQAYFDGAQFVHFLLGPATVALAIPLYAQWPRLKAMAGPLMIALVAGSLTAALSAWGIGALLGGSRESLMSLAPKSVTTPIAIGVATGVGTHPPARRPPRLAAVARTQERAHADRDGRGRAHRRPAFADRGAGDQRRHHRRGVRPRRDAPPARQRPRGAWLRHRHRLARHRHRARLPGQRAGGRLRRPGDGTERTDHRGVPALAHALGGAAVRRLNALRPRRFLPRP